MDKKERDILKIVSVLLPVIVALVGLGSQIYAHYQEPDFTNGQYYTTAWIEYGLNQNTLNVEYVPDGKGAVLPAMNEALQRVAIKAEINAKIDDKPLLIIGWVRYKSDLVAISQILLTSKEMDVIEHGTSAERRALAEIISARSEFLYNKTQVMIERDNKLIFVPISDLNVTLERTVEFARQYHMEELGYA